jgi:hypothetical protein
LSYCLTINKHTYVWITIWELSIPRQRLGDMSYGMDHFHSLRLVGGNRRQTANELVDKLLEENYDGLLRTDIALLESITPTAQESSDWAKANNGYRDLKEDCGHPGTDWMDALKMKNVDLTSLLVKMRQAL